MSEDPAGNPPTEADQSVPAVRYASGSHPVLASEPSPASPPRRTLPLPAPEPAAPTPEPAATEFDESLFPPRFVPANAAPTSGPPAPAAVPLPPAFVPAAASDDPSLDPALFAPVSDYRASSPPPARQTLDPTGEWPSPDPAEFAEEDTDPTGFPSIPGFSYPPATDPFDDPAFTSAYPLPGWSAPPELEPSPAATRSRRPVLIAIAAFLGLAGVIAAFLLVPRNDPNPSAAAATAPAEAPGEAAPGKTEPDGARTVTAPRDGLESATFDILDSATLVQLTAADLGDDLYRVSTPAGSGLTPSADRSDDTVKLRLRSDGSGGSAAVTIQLSSEVRWTLRLDGGTAQSRLDLTGADLAALDLNGGASRIDLSLPSPHGVLPVRMTGGVDQFQVTLSGTTPVRVRVQSGAGQVTLDGTTHKGIAPGRSFTTDNWAGTAGIDLLAVAGLSALTVTN